jgi:hypothetical protein
MERTQNLPMESNVRIVNMMEERVVNSPCMYKETVYVFSRLQFQSFVKNSCCCLVEYRHILVVGT